MYRRLFAEHQGLDKPEVDFVELPEVNKEVTDYDRVVNLVFVPDHRTALPSSDISVTSLLTSGSSTKSTSGLSKP